MLTFEVSAVSPAEFSLVCRPLWGPGLGFFPDLKAFKTALVVSGVRSSCCRVKRVVRVTGMTTTHIEVIINHHHGCIAASSLAFHLNNSEFSVLCRFSSLDSAEVVADGLQDISRAAKHARRSCANLDKVFTNRFSGAAVRGWQRGSTTKVTG